MSVFSDDVYQADICEHENIFGSNFNSATLQHLSIELRQHSVLTHKTTTAFFTKYILTFSFDTWVVISQ